MGGGGDEEDSPFFFAWYVQIWGDQADLEGQTAGAIAYAKK